MSHVNPEQLMQQYAKFHKVASEDLTGWDWRTLPGKQMQQREAQDALPAILSQYSAYVAKAAIPIFIQGAPDTSRQFAEVAEAEADTITLPVDGLYREIAAQVEPSMGDRRNFTASQLVGFVHALTDHAKSLDFSGQTQPPTFDTVHCPTTDDVVAVVRSLTRTTMGDELNVRYLQAAVIRAALEKRYTKAVVPVVLVGATEDEIQTLPKLIFGGTNSFTVPVTTETATPEQVLQTFTNIKKALKARK